VSGTLVSHPIVLRELRVARIADLGPRMRRITLTGEQLGAWQGGGWSHPAFRSDAADDHVKVFPPPPGGGRPVLPAQADGHLDWPGDHSVVHRDYTVRRHDAAAGELDLDFVIHDGGVAATWVAGVEVGDVLHVAGPRSSHLAPEVAHLVLVGDETALPAIARWIEEAPPATAVTALVEVADEADEQAVARPGGGRLDLRFVHRAAGEDLLAQVRSLGAFGDAYAFAAGEHALVARLRQHLRDDRGLPADRIRAVGYWRRGVSEQEAHAAGHRLAEMAELLTPYAIRTAATLRLADHVHGGADTAAALADRAAADPVTVAALVEHLADRGLFELSDAGRIGLTPLGEALRDDHPSGARRRLDDASAHSHMDRAWAGLARTAAVAGTGTGYEHTFGTSFWDHVHSDPALASSFDGYMAEWAYQWVPAVRDAHPWSAYGHIVDVGGGMGLLLAELLSVAPDARGTVVELPATAATATWWFEERGLTARAQAVEGSFFEPLPEGDGIVLAQVLHDWPDDDAARILTSAAEALSGDGARVLLVERLAQEGRGRSGHAAMTLLMRNLFGATERSEADYAALARRAGLRVVATTAVVHGLHLIELGPA